MDGGGWASYWNSLKLAALTAMFGTAIIFLGAYLVEKTPRFWLLRAPIQFAGAAAARRAGPRAGPGLHLLLQQPGNPFRFLYGTMAILVLCTIAHFYPVAHLTATTALNRSTPSSRRYPHRCVCRFTARSCSSPCRSAAGRARDRDVLVRERDDDGLGGRLPLLAPYHACAIAVLNMDDAGDVAPAAAMAMMIF